MGGSIDWANEHYWLNALVNRLLIYFVTQLLIFVFLPPNTNSICNTINEFKHSARLHAILCVYLYIAISPITALGLSKWSTIVLYYIVFTFELWKGIFLSSLLRWFYVISFAQSHFACGCCFHSHINYIATFLCL